MAMNDGEDDTSTLAPDDAFAVLGNETRMEILQILGEADESLSFSELRDRVGMRDSGQFNYHLDQLTGHFVRQTDEGYELRQAGSRVIEAVLSGTVTDAPVIEPTEVDSPCLYCGAPVKVSFQEEHVKIYCTNCAGTYSESPVRVTPVEEDRDTEELGSVGELSLPPAGIYGRTPTEVLKASYTWGALELLAAFSGVCPRCAAVLEEEVSVCEEHEFANGVCTQCGLRYAAMWDTTCTNCLYETRAPLMVKSLANTEVLAFLTIHDLNPLGNFWSGGWEYDEEILGTDPFEAQFTWTIDEDILTFTVDEDLSIVDITKESVSRT